MLSLGFIYVAFIVLTYITSVLHLLRVITMKSYGIWSNAIDGAVEMIMSFCLLAFQEDLALVLF
jgi:hypothetical protein